MTAHKSIKPETFDDLLGIVVQLDNELSANQGALATTLDVTSGQMTRLSNDHKILVWIGDTLSIINQEKQAVTAIKDLICFGDLNVTVPDVVITAPTTPPAIVLSGVWKRTSKLIKRIKDHDNYNEPIGKLLKIVGTLIVVNPDEMQPVVTEKYNLENKMGFDYTKGTYADGLAVYCHTYIAGTAVPTDPGDDIDFEFLGFFTGVPYVDYRLNQKKQAETRIYKFYFMKGDKIIGKASALVTVTCKVYVSVDGAELSGKIK